MNWHRAIAIALVVGSASVHTYAAPLTGLDTDWKRISPHAWHRQIGGLGGSADIFLFVQDGAKWYRVLTPCGNERFRQLTWPAGSQIAEEVTCEGASREDDTTKAWEETAGEPPPEINELLRHMPLGPRYWDRSRT